MAGGASDRGGENPLGGPITPQMMIASLWKHLEIDPAVYFNDNTGRPLPILDEREAIPELFGGHSP